MNSPIPTISLDVDLTNPGQFLACCGLLELASRVDADACGHFTDKAFTVQSSSAQSLRGRLCELTSTLVFDPQKDERIDSLKSKRKTLTNVEKQELKLLEQERRIAPILLKMRDGTLLLNWWNDESATQAGFKTWSGAQTPKPIIEGMQRHLRTIGSTVDLWTSIPILEPKPFYFDSRISRLTSLDLGFSADGFTARFSPAVELLAFIGMQRFRPGTVVDRERYAFATWRCPLPVSIAAAVASGLIPSLVDHRYQFPLVVRTGDKYKAFGPATLERSFHA